MQFGLPGAIVTLLSMLAVLLVLTCAPFAQAGLVYSALRQNTWGIYFQADLASAPEPVGGDIAGDGSAPALAPDGQQVAFEVQGAGIYVCPVGPPAKCQMIRPDRGSAVRPTWQPMTGELLFVRYLANGTNEDSDVLTTHDSLAGMSTFLTQTGVQDYPDVSPNGRMLVYTSGHTISLHKSGVQVVQQLWIMNLETGTARQLILNNTQEIQPDWSPSGRALAFASDHTGQFEIWVVSADDSGLRQVTSGPGTKTWPAWSPDGKSIMFTLARDGRQSLCLIDADGSNLRPFEPFGPELDIELRDADWR